MLNWVLLISVLTNYSVIEKPFVEEKTNKGKSPGAKPSRQDCERELIRSIKEIFTTVSNLSILAEELSFDLTKLKKELKRKEKSK
ncbi:MAG: hypothetical protein DRQ13_08315 [Ignavibacteriae bacterium]|nr:MAG: hypothetical protein DRQ13_08315 [Ignavibacteriota bacterium]